MCTHSGTVPLKEFDWTSTLKKLTGQLKAHKNQSLKKQTFLKMKVKILPQLSYKCQNCPVSCKWNATVHYYKCELRMSNKLQLINH